ncbi:MAG: sulfate adenylyltransferase subunit 1, partial [Bacteroidales bacterium]
INTYYKYKNLIRFTTAGSVDDGKSTLIGRLLYDSKSIFEDQLKHITESGRRLGKEEMDLSLLTDGLRAEREQGITIDVAYQYFATTSRKFIIADTPGHTQYTRNMVTGASTADIAIILVDARKGVLEQTLRHTYIANLLDIKYFVFCINKMDVVNYNQTIFNEIIKSLNKIAGLLNIKNICFIPISAKYGDNVVKKSINMTWYQGDILLHYLETVKVPKNKNSGFPRLPVQTVIRPQSAEYHDYRGYAGRISGGTFKTGDEIIAIPSMMKSTIRTIDVYGKSLHEASEGDSVAVTLTDEIDIGRGDLIVLSGKTPKSGNEITAMICWFNEKPLTPGKKYILRNHTNETKCLVNAVNYKVNINNLEKETDSNELKMNDIAEIVIKTANPVYYDSYRENNITGSFILIDEYTNETVAAGMIV